MPVTLKLPLQSDGEHNGLQWFHIDMCLIARPALAPVTQEPAFGTGTSNITDQRRYSSNTIKADCRLVHMQICQNKLRGSCGEGEQAQRKEFNWSPHIDIKYKNKYF